MGGKTWSQEEEQMFWRVIVPQSPKAVNPTDRTVNWENCAQMMQKKMGEGARRRYTKLMLFEHYFQNVTTGHKSPHAKKFVLEHKRQLAMAHGEDTRSNATLYCQSPSKSSSSPSRSPAMSTAVRSRRRSSFCLSTSSEGRPMTPSSVASQETVTACIPGIRVVVSQVSDLRACGEVGSIASGSEEMATPRWSMSQVCEKRNVVKRAPVAVMSVQVAVDRFCEPSEDPGQDYMQRFLRDASVEVQ